MVQVRGTRRGGRLAGAARPTSWLGPLAALVLLASAACSLHQAGVTPPDDRIFFPSGGVVDPDGAWLFVANSNSDLRYNAGTIVTVNLAAVGAARESALKEGAEVCPADPRYVPPVSKTPYCCWDFLDSTVLNCDDQSLLVPEWSVRVGSFAGTPVIQRFLVANPDFRPDHRDAAVPELIEPPDWDRRLFVPVRGDTSITMMNLARGPTPDQPLPSGKPKFYCTGDRRDPNALDGAGPLPPQPRFQSCEGQWRITRRDDPLETPAKEIPDSDVMHLPDEPYALAVDEAARLLYVGHLRGEVSLVDLGLPTVTSSMGPSVGSPSVPNLLDHSHSVLPGDANGSVGVTSLTLRDATSTSCHKEIFASSRYRPVASSFVIYGLNGARCDDSATRGESDEGLVIVPTGTTYSTGLTGSDTRGIQFVNPDRIFLLQRNPPALVGIDADSQAPLSTMEVCQGPANLAQPFKSDGKTPLFGQPLLFVTCFDSGEVYVVDPAVPQIRSIIQVGRQPIATVFDSTDPSRAYVIGFGANNVSVVDLDPTSPTRNRVIQRIGFPSATPRDVGPQ